MAYWLAKSEPDVFSWDDLVQRGRTDWDGVRNYAARNNLMAMQVGDEVLFYHSNIGVEVVGIMRVTKPHFPDPSMTPDELKGKWVAVELVPNKPLKQPVQLKIIKQTPVLQQMQLIKQSRLSVSAVTEDEFRLILQMGGL